MKLGVAVIGGGRWGSHYVRLLLDHPKFVLRALVDSCPLKLQECREKYHLDEQKIPCFQNWQDITHDDLIKVVIVATPATTHYHLIKALLNLGYHVLAEKPLTTNSLECLELTQLAKHHDLQLFIDHTYLFNPYIIHCKKLIDEDKLGNLHYGYASRTHFDAIRSDVDCIWDLAIHDLAIFHFILDKKPLKLQAKASYFLRENIADTAWLKLIYPDDFYVDIHVSWLNHDKQRKLTIVGEKASLIFDEMSSSVLTLNSANLAQENDNFFPENREQETFNFVPFNTLEIVLDSFGHSLTPAPSTPCSSAELATDLVKILEGFDQSLAQEGEWIDFQC